MDRWDIMLYVVAAYVAVMALVRLMNHRRNQLVSDLRNQLRRTQSAQQPPEPANDDPAA